MNVTGRFCEAFVNMLYCLNLTVKRTMSGWIYFAEITARLAAARERATDSPMP